MVTIPALWLPILVATVLVFVASCIVWMALPQPQVGRAPHARRGAALEALGRQNLKPGLYRFPWADSMAEMKDPAFVAKLDKGPVALMTVLPSGPSTWRSRWRSGGLPGRDRHLRRLRHGPRARPAARATSRCFASAGTVACLAYSGSQLPNAIWWGKPLSVVFKEIVDGVVYGLLTAGAFGWLVAPL
jgi:hypothetical protein